MKPTDSTSGRHPLRGLLTAQFLGALNDNAWKLIVALLPIRFIQASLESSPAEFEAASQQQMALAFVIFTLPLLLFSLPASFFADRFSKRTIIVAMKAVEIFIMAAGTLVLAAWPGATWLLLALLALMGVQSALFSPAKYGILPEILPHEKLSSGNALMEMWTFLAIIGGTGIAGGLLRISGEATWMAGAALTALAVIGFAASFGVPRVSPAGSPEPALSVIRGAWRAIRGERVLWLTVLGMAFFWGIATLLSQDLLVYARTALGCDDLETGLLLVSYGVGVGAGSLLAARLSAHKVEVGLIPLGAIGLALFTLLLGGFASEAVDEERAGTLYALILSLALPLGVASGLILVPLDALLQWRSPASRRGAVIALTNVLVFGGSLLGSFLTWTLAASGLSSRGILLAAAFITVLGTSWALWLLPDALLRFVLVLLTHSIYRLRVVGRANVPQRGGALLVPNHVSFVDGLFLLATIDRPVRFLVDSSYFHHPLLRPFLKALGAIPISSSGGPRMILRALRAAGEHLDAGDIVCIFAEGEITRTGMLLPFRRGLERIVKGRSAPIIPVHLDRVWGSIFSWEGGRFVFKWPRRIPYPVTVSFGAALPPAAGVHDVRRAVHELAEAAWHHRRADRRLLHRELVRAARRRPFAFAGADESRRRASRIQVLAGAVAVARLLRGRWRGQENVGILLPPTLAGAIVNFAAALAGRASVNLNYTAGRAGIESAARQARLTSVVTSRQFLEKAGVDLPPGVEPVWLDELTAGAGRWQRLVALGLALLAPCRLLERLCGALRRIELDDTVTIIFSSGSTGEPKGVLLSHDNIASNVEGVLQVMRTTRRDRLLGILPFFHSFGYMALWFAVRQGMGVVFHPNPLDAGKIGELVQRYRITILIATPTFLQLYLRRCTPGQFGSLRLVLAGAEKLPPRLSVAFEEHFGIRPLEGYGTTECSPVVATSGLDYRAPGFYQAASRRGSVGPPIPGLAVRIVDPDREFDPRTSEPLPPGAPGLLVVKGPGVMKGYLGRDDLTRQVIRDGWYITGDIAAMDEAGFIHITDRLSRFSKIGGEMVPHGRVEEALHEAAGAAGQVFAVTAIPDERKGERLAVLHTLPERDIPAIVEKLSAMGLPNLFIPRADQFVAVEKLPLLGSGKLDLRGAKAIAMERLKRQA